MSPQYSFYFANSEINLDNSEVIYYFAGTTNHGDFAKHTGGMPPRREQQFVILCPFQPTLHPGDVTDEARKEPLRGERRGSNSRGKN